MYRNDGLWGHSSGHGGKEYIIFASVYKPEDVTARLKKWEVPFKQLVGCYKGIMEAAYMVEKRADSRVRNLLEGQESILFLGPCDARDRRPATLIFRGKDPENDVDLGKFHSVSHSYAMEQDAWTFDPSLNAWFVCTKGE